jgi:hypothetical protein
MTVESKDPREQLNLVAQLLIEDLFNTPDDELLKEATEDKSLVEAGVKAKRSYQDAIKTLGAKRLQIARVEMAQENNNIKTNIANVDAVRAHRVIAKLAASNDSNITLAARNLNNISDTEAIELVKELMELGAIKDDDL